MGEVAGGADGTYSLLFIEMLPAQRDNTTPGAAAGHVLCDKTAAATAVAHGLVGLPALLDVHIAHRNRGALISHTEGAAGLLTLFWFCHVRAINEALRRLINYGMPAFNAKIVILLN